MWKERLSEFVRGVKGELADAREGLVKPLAHGVEHFGQAVKLVAAAAAEQALTQIVLVEAFGGLGERGDWRQRPPHHPPAAAQRQHASRHPAPEDNPKDFSKIAFVGFVGV